MAQAQVEADERAPVVRHERDAFDAEGIEQPDHVRDEGVGVIAVGRGIGLTGAAQVGRDHARAATEIRHHRGVLA